MSTEALRTNAKDLLMTLLSVLAGLFVFRNFCKNHSRHISRY